MKRAARVNPLSCLPQRESAGTGLSGLAPAGPQLAAGTARSGMTNYQKNVRRHAIPLAPAHPHLPADGWTPTHRALREEQASEPVERQAMNDQVSQGYGAVAATAETGWLTTSFVLIALGAALAVFILLWGTRLAIRRRQAREELDERGELEVADAPEPLATLPPPPSTPAAPEPTSAPAPLDDEPIAAAVPVGVPSAALAADTNAVPPATPAIEGDDLTRLKGVGPKLAARLNELGITRFAQLAALNEAAAQALDAQLGSFQGRMTRDRWIEQSRFLASGDTTGYEAVFGKL